MKVHALLFSLTLAACSSSPSATGPDGGTPAASPAPTGAGVCCPITAVEGCSPHGVLGGWAASAAQCHEVELYDGYPFLRKTDEHGCEALVATVTSRQCGEAPPRPVDAAVQATCEDGGTSPECACPAQAPAADSTCTGLERDCRYGGVACAQAGYGTMRCRGEKWSLLCDPPGPFPLDGGK